MIKVFFSIALCLILNGSVSAQDNFLDVLTNGPKSSTNNFYKKIHDDQGNYCSIPISIIKGKKNGPVFTIVAGVHGFEYPPIIAAQELIQEIKPELLSGTIVIIPLANPNSFYSRTPFLNPQDNLNLNRVFPGSENGSITEKIANFITTIVIEHTEIFIDMHGGDANEDLLPFICYYNNTSKTIQTQQAKTLSESSGFEYIVSYPYNLKETDKAKYAFKQAVQNGKTALSIECGKLGNVQKDAIDLIKNGMYNMLTEMEMYQKKKTNKSNFTRLNKQVYIKSKERGIFHSSYSAGDSVNKGDIVGYIKDEFGNIITKITASNSGIILYKIGTPPVNVGDTLMCIAYTL